MLVNILEDIAAVLQVAPVFEQELVALIGLFSKHKNNPQMRASLVKAAAQLGGGQVASQPAQAKVPVAI